jgi:hypothetical protein
MSSVQFDRNRRSNSPGIGGPIRPESAVQFDRNRRSNWAGACIVRAGQRIFSANQDIKFWLPTVEYFIEMPFRIGDAQIAAHAGTRTLNDQTYDLIYLTWGSPAPQRHIDQYVAWIRRSDGILEFVEYTVRDLAPFMTGCIHYEDLRDIDGVLLPFRMTLGDCPGKPGLLHRQTLEAARFLKDLPRHELLPEPERRASKND